MTQVRVINNQKEWDDLDNRLRDNLRDLHEADKSLNGWADRIMNSILRPLGKDGLSKYPIGHEVPFRRGPAPYVHWNDEFNNK